jgi:lactate dehydrogenase-like 2-hydroxyacid dehydrogenase
MKVFIFDPLWYKLVDENIENKLAASGLNITVIDDIKPLSETPELFEGTEDRILCLNPDYVSWSLKSNEYKDIPNLKAILTASTGFEWIDQENANERNIAICNIKDFSTQAVAEWAVLMMSNLARQTPRLIKDDFPLDYDKDFLEYRGLQLKGKTAGIIGLGNIGSAIAKICQGYGMNVIYWSRSSVNVDYRKASVDELMSSSDVVIPALTKNEETLKLITIDHIKSMKESAILVDIAHGLFDEELVLNRVREDKLFGFGFEGKPGKFNSYAGNVWAAPPYAWTTYESMYNSELKLVENIIDAARGAFPNKVN